VRQAGIVTIYRGAKIQKHLFEPALMNNATGRCPINTLEDVLLEQIFAHVQFHER